MNKLALILASGLAGLTVTACGPRHTAQTPPPLDAQEVRRYNQWLADQDREPPQGFEAAPLYVSAFGKTKAVPDIAVVTGLIETEAKIDRAAVDEAAVIMNAVQSAIDGQDVELNFSAIQTREERGEDCLAHNVRANDRLRRIQDDNRFNQRLKQQQKYQKDPVGEPRKPRTRIAQKVCPVVKVTVELGFTARIKPADKAGEIINAMTAAGVETVSLYGYDFSNYDALYKEASANAVTGAKAKAEMIARVAGTQLLEMTDFTITPPARQAPLGPQGNMIARGGVEYITTPAVYETYTEAIVVQEASTELVTVPPTYETVTETVVVQPQSVQYVNGQAIETPAQTKQVTRRVVKTPASTQERVIPPITKMESRRRIKTPARAVERVITPASNSLRMVMETGPQTIFATATLAYQYETPLDGFVPEEK